jgi:hypothetical protein
MSVNNVDSIKQMNEESFRPVDAHIRAKSQFWARFSENPICDAADISLAVVTRFVPDSRLPRWWTIPGFSAWFTNANEWRELMESTAYKALLKLDEIISMATEPKLAGPQVQAIKLLFEAGRKMPPKSAPQVKMLDEGVNKMDMEQLKAFIQKNAAVLRPLLAEDGEK